MRNYFISTAHGQVVMSAEPSVMTQQGPVALLIHGAFRGAGKMVPLGRQLSACIYAYLPDHGTPQLAAAKLDVWASAFSEAISRALPRPVLVIGESLGGVLGMALNLPALAIDPFTRTNGLWPLEPVLAHGAQNGLSQGALSLLSPGNDFRREIQQRSAPLCVLASDEALNPLRAVERAPSLLSAEDEAWLSQFGAVERIAGGHNLIDDNLRGCVEAAQRCLTEFFPAVDIATTNSRSST